MTDSRQKIIIFPIGKFVKKDEKKIAHVFNTLPENCQIIVPYEGQFSNIMRSLAATKNIGITIVQLNKKYVEKIARQKQYEEILKEKPISAIALIKHRNGWVSNRNYISFSEYFSEEGKFTVNLTAYLNTANGFIVYTPFQIGMIREKEIPIMTIQVS